MLNAYIPRNISIIIITDCFPSLLPLPRILGHTDLTMTKRYVALTQDDLKEQHAHASPVNRLIPERKKVRKIR